MTLANGVEQMSRAQRRRGLRVVVSDFLTPGDHELDPNVPPEWERAMRRRQRPGLACAIARRTAIRRDRAAIAAVRPGTGRVHLIDLTRFMCSPKLCYPVIGGVLVHKDITHMTPLFASTLGPFLLSSVNRMYGSKSARR